MADADGVLIVNRQVVSEDIAPFECARAAPARNVCSQRLRVASADANPGVCPLTAMAARASRGGEGRAWRGCSSHPSARAASGPHKALLCEVTAHGLVAWGDRTRPCCVACADVWHRRLATSGRPAVSLNFRAPNLTHTLSGRAYPASTLIALLPSLPPISTAPCFQPLPSLPPAPRRYTPKPEFEGKFRVINALDERSTIAAFFELVREKKPHVLVTYNGDSFDWPCAPHALARSARAACASACMQQALDRVWRRVRS